MKSSILGLVLVAFSQLALAAPAGLVKRASASEACNVGYCTMNGGTTGGSGGTTTIVDSLDKLKAAAAGDSKAIVIISGTIVGDCVVYVGSNKSILGKDGNAQLVGIGLRVRGESNVIIRNLKISKVLATAGDAIGIQSSHNVWIDHVDLSSDKDHGKDFYDGLLDITHGCDWVTVSYSRFHDHYKTSLVGGSDGDGPEDIDHLTVTYTRNHWKNIESRAPSFRFGTGHIFNNLYESVSDAINTRDGAQLLVENNVFVGSKKALYSTNAGYAVARDNDFGGCQNLALEGTIKSMPYTYSLTETSATKAHVLKNAGNILSLGGN